MKSPQRIEKDECHREEAEHRKNHDLYQLSAYGNAYDADDRRYAEDD